MDLAVSASPRDAGVGPASLLHRAVWPTLVFLILVAVVVRISVDGPNVVAGTVPPEDAYEHRYASHWILAYAHILPGVVYLLGAPLQLSQRFRQRHLSRHRRLGRVVLAAGITSGVLAIVFGTLFAFGGPIETSATIVFGAYFVAALLLAYAAIRRRDVLAHRRWMIRAFAIGLAIATIRIWIGLFQGFGLLSLEDSFGPAFWLSFVMHALVVEAYLAKRPTVTGVSRA